MRNASMFQNCFCNLQHNLTKLFGQRFFSARFQIVNQLEDLELFMESEVKTNTEESKGSYLQGMHETLEHNFQSGKYSVCLGKNARP